MVRRLLPHLKRFCAGPRDLWSWCGAACNMAAIAVRHEKTRAEVHKSLATSRRGVAAPDGAASRPFARCRDGLVEMLDGSQEAYRSELVLVGRTVIHRMLASGGTETSWRAPEDVPADVATAFIARVPANLNTQPQRAVVLPHAVAWLGRADAADMFVPRKYIAKLGLRVDAATAQTMVGDTSSYYRRRPVRTEPKVGRNERCPCGSGRKHKSCCLRGEEGVRSVSDLRE